MAGSSRPLVGLDKTKAFKVIAGHPNLSGATKAVAALIVDHFNIKTERCDPGLERLADKTGFTTRTVRRSLRALEAERLLKSLRYGGHNQTNAYQINWGLIRHLANQSRGDNSVSNPGQKYPPKPRRKPRS